VAPARPEGVASFADREYVRVRCRDGATLLLTREDCASSTTEGAVAAALALRNLLAHMEPQIAAAALVDEFHELTSYLSEIKLSS
jgi:hypothetical protein